MDGFIQQANVDEILQLSRVTTLSWLAFFAFAMLALAGLSLLNRDREAVAELRAYRRHRRRYRKRLRAARATAARNGTTTAAVISKPLPGERTEPLHVELRRYATEVATAASHAEQTAARCRTEWEAAERIQQAAWRALQAATEAAERANRASAFASVVDEIEESSAEPTRDELEERRAHLRRAASRAFHRGEIRYDQLSEVLTFRGEWSPSVSPLEHERSLLRLAQERLNAAYQEATRVERRAWDLAATASAAKTSLAQEATEAELRAALAAAEALTPKGLAAVLAKVGAVRVAGAKRVPAVTPQPAVAEMPAVVEIVETTVALPAPAEDVEATTDITAITASAAEEVEATIVIETSATAEWEIEASAVVAAAQAEIEAAASRAEDASPEDTAALTPASLPVMGIARVPLRSIPAPRGTEETVDGAAEAPTVSARAAVTAPGAVVAGRARVQPRVVAVVGTKDSAPADDDDDDPTSSTVSVLVSK